MTEERRLLIQKALHVRPHSYVELAAIADLHIDAVAHHIRTLRGLELVHVAGWTREGDYGPHSPRFAWGDKPDVDRPPARSAAQRMAESRANRRD